jgi:hypothetical protein
MNTLYRIKKKLLIILIGLASTGEAMQHGKLENIELVNIKTQGDINQLPLSRDKIWEINAEEAAKTWNLTLQQIKDEAVNFLLKYWETHPGKSYPSCVTDLIVYKKPDTTELEEKINYYNKENPENPLRIEDYKRSTHKFGIFLR